MRTHKFWKQTSGLAAVEFAFVLPVMLSFFLGLIEVSQALSCRASVTDLAATGSDLVAQESSVTTADMTNVFSALSAMLFPFDATRSQDYHFQRRRQQHRHHRKGGVELHLWRHSTCRQFGGDSSNGRHHAGRRRQRHPVGGEL